MRASDDFDLQIVPLPKRAAIKPGVPPADADGIWLNGDVLACACPDCRAPMSVRLWLGMADCWRCGTSIELTEAQERAAARLLEARLPAPSPSPTLRPTPNSATIKSAPPPARPKQAPAKAPRPAVRPVAAPISVPAISPRIATPPRVSAIPPVALHANARLALDRAQQRFRDLPAWLTSILVHLLILISLLMARSRADRISPSVLLASAQSATSPIEPIGTPPSNSLPAAPERMLEARNDQSREKLVQADGGDAQTEAAVAAGLRWMSQHQSPDGRWTLDHFQDSPECNQQCSGAGQHSDTAGTALALLPMLGAGQTHKQGDYRESVGRGLHWLVDNQRPTGDLRGEGMGRMYAHALSTLVLCEALSMTGDEFLRQPAQRAVDFIVKAQHVDGGWRYEPGQAGDMSVVGWQLMALRSGKVAGLSVPENCFDRANRFLNRVQSGKAGGFYSYEPGRKPTAAMIAEGLLSRQYLGWPADHPGLREGLDLLVEKHLPRASNYDIYALYYATQVAHHVGGDAWQKWNVAMRQTLLDSRETHGHAAGSWLPKRVDHLAQSGGRLYFTSLAICTLEVYYRYLPLYRGVELKK